MSEETQESEIPVYDVRNFSDYNTEDLTALVQYVSSIRRPPEWSLKTVILEALRWHDTYNRITFEPQSRGKRTSKPLVPVTSHHSSYPLTYYLCPPEQLFGDPCWELMLATGAKTEAPREFVEHVGRSLLMQFQRVGEVASSREDILLTSGADFSTFRIRFEANTRSREERTLLTNVHDLRRALRVEDSHIGYIKTQLDSAIHNAEVVRRYQQKCNIREQDMDEYIGNMFRIQDLLTRIEELSDNIQAAAEAACDTFK
jgi:hypothetical protein